MVVVQHAMPSLGSAGLRAWAAPLEIGSVAVLLFFVLSGFIVTEASAMFYEGRGPAFALNRMIRIYPPYAVAVVLTALVSSAILSLGGSGAVVSVFGSWPDLSMSNILASLFGILPVVGKLVEPVGTEPILILAWALRVELLFYGIVFLALVGGRMFSQPMARLLGVVGFCLLAFDGIRFEYLRGSALEFTPYFVLGTSIYFAITPASMPRRAMALALALASGVMIAAHIGGQTLFNEKAGFARDLHGQTIIFFAGILIWLSLITIPRFWPGLGRRIRDADSALGELTYPLYLTHMAALVLSLWLVPAESSFAWPIALGATLVTAQLMTHLVESRLLALRQRVRGRAAVAPALTLQVRLPSPDQTAF